MLHLQPIRENVWVHCSHSWLRTGFSVWCYLFYPNCVNTSSPHPFLVGIPLGGFTSRGTAASTQPGLGGAARSCSEMPIKAALQRLSKHLHTPPSPCLSQLASARPPGGRRSWGGRAVTYGKELKFESARRRPQSSYSRHVMLDETLQFHCCLSLPCTHRASQSPARLPGWG